MNYEILKSKLEARRTVIELNKGIKRFPGYTTPGGYTKTVTGWKKKPSGKKHFALEGIEGPKGVAKKRTAQKKTAQEHQQNQEKKFKNSLTEKRAEIKELETRYKNIEEKIRQAVKVKMPGWKLDVKTMKLQQNAIINKLKYKPETE